jgi:hypothetical protein
MYDIMISQKLAEAKMCDNQTRSDVYKNVILSNKQATNLIVEAGIARILDEQTTRN